MAPRVKEKFLDSSMASESEVQTFINAKVATLTSRIRASVCANVEPSTTAYTSVGEKFIWINSRNSSYKNGALLVSFTNTGATRWIEFRLVNSVTGVVLASRQIATTDASGVVSLSIANPTADCTLDFQVRKQSSNGIGGKIDSAVIEFNTI